MKNFNIFSRVNAYSIVFQRVNFTPNSDCQYPSGSNRLILLGFMKQFFVFTF